MDENRMPPVIVGFILFLVLLSITRSLESVLPLLILGGLLYGFARSNIQINLSGRAARRGRPTRQPDEETFDMGTQNRPEPVYKHALEAVQRVGHDPNTLAVLPVDIGVMAFKHDYEPVVYRTWHVPDDIDYIQPFVQLRLPTKAVGRIRFEIIDSSGEVLFVHEENHQLVRGRNLVTPAARLPVHDAQALDGRWQIRISADNTLLAMHHFEWEEAAASAIRKHLTADGEISHEMRAVLAESRLQKLSLDDLLSDQTNTNDAPKQRQQRG